VLVIGPKIRGFKPGRGRRIFNGYKDRSPISFTGKVKPSVSCRNIYSMLKNATCIKEILRQISAVISRQVSTASLLDVSADIFDDSRTIRNRMISVQRSPYAQPSKVKA
jgi:hypothetical protein